MATLCHDAVMNPADVIKQRLQMYNSPYKTALSCCRDIWKREGIGAFYRSYNTQLFMNVPFQSIHFIIYEKMQEVSNPARQYNPNVHVVAGAVAGGIASALTTPLDVCKTLLNTQETQTLAVSKQPQIRGLFRAASTIYKCCGYRGFFRGLTARVMYSMPSTAISWSVYEFFKYSLNQRKTTGGMTAHSSSHSTTSRASNLGSGSESKWDKNSPDLAVAEHYVVKNVNQT